MALIRRGSFYCLAISILTKDKDPIIKSRCQLNTGTPLGRFTLFYLYVKMIRNNLTQMLPDGLDQLSTSVTLPYKLSQNGSKRQDAVESKKE